MYCGQSLAISDLKESQAITKTLTSSDVKVPNLFYRA
jgi:hypothetical protein